MTAKAASGANSSLIDLNAYDVRGLSGQAEAGELATLVKTAATERFLCNALTRIVNNSFVSPKRYQLGRQVIVTFKNEAMNHLYRVLLEFIVVYMSFRASNSTQSTIVQGSFLPDFMRVVDISYDDGVASTFCPAKKLTTRTGRSTRGILSSIAAPDELRRSPFVERKRHRTGKGGEEAARKVDVSCILVSNSRLLSKSFFRSLGFFLERALREMSNRNLPSVRFSTDFAIEVNQAFVYLLYRSLELTLIIAQGRVGSRNLNTRINVSDVVEAFARILPVPVVPPTRGRVASSRHSDSGYGRNRSRSRSRRRAMVVDDDDAAAAAAAAAE